MQNYNSQGAGREEVLTGGGAPESAPARSLSSVNQNNDCAAGSLGARRRTVSSRRRESGARRSPGRAVPTPGSRPPAQTLPGARSPEPGARAPQPPLGSRASLGAADGARASHSPKPREPSPAMWMPTEHEKYGVGESAAANSQPAPAAAGAHPASSPPPGTPHPGAAAGSGVGERGSRPASRPRPGAARGRPTVRAPPAEFGVAAGRACVKLEEGGDGVPRLPSPSPAAGCSGFPGERGTTAAAQREHPETEGRRGPPPARVGIAGVRSGAPRSRPLWRTGPAGASLPPAVPVLGRAGRVGGARALQRLRGSALCSPEGNGSCSRVFASGHPRPAASAAGVRTEGRGAAVGRGRGQPASAGRGHRGRDRLPPAPAWGAEGAGERSPLWAEANNKGY